jgi:flagellin
MIGSLSSSLALAQRTATKARATMDTMARQIATGQKVASVKDDGAAWTRAALIKAEQSRLNVVKGWAQEAVMRNDATMAMRETELEALDTLRNLVMNARATEIGSSARAAVAAEIYGVIDHMKGQSLPESVWNASFGVNHYAYENDSITAGLRVSWSNPPGIFLGFDTDARFLNIETKTPAELNATAAQVANWDNIIRNVQATSGSDHARAVRTSDRIDQAQLQLEQQLGSLTDADLGQVSAIRAQADTRQQLAVQTIQQAIATYSNFAGGLLGNVQRTQSGVLA